MDRQLNKKNAKRNLLHCELNSRKHKEVIENTYANGDVINKVIIEEITAKSFIHPLA